MNKYRIIAIIITLLALQINVYADNKITQEIKQVKVQTITTTEIFDTYKYPVVVEPKYEREIHAEITGAASKVYVTVGELVQQGDALMQLKPATPGFAEFTVTSPMTGEVTKVAKKTGSHVEKGDLLIHIVEPNEFTLKIEVPQAELALLQARQVGEVKFRAVDIALPVVISGISSFIAPETGTATGQLEWDSKNFAADEQNLIKQHIYPGMLGTVTFKLNKRIGLAILSSAVLYEKNENKVRLVKAGKAVKITVKLGKYLDSGMVEITNGLQADDVVIMSAGKYIRENEPVVVENSIKE